MENFQDDLINQLRKFRQPSNQLWVQKVNTMSGCQQVLKQRWAEWYKYLYNIDLFKLHDANKSGLRLNQLLCHEIDMLSDDSDIERDSKYNILDESEYIDEEDENAEYDDESDGGGDYTETTDNNSKQAPNNVNRSHSSSESAALAGNGVEDKIKNRQKESDIW